MAESHKLKPAISAVLAEQSGFGSGRARLEHRPGLCTYFTALGMDAKIRRLSEASYGSRFLDTDDQADVIKRGMSS